MNINCNTLRLLRAIGIPNEIEKVHTAPMNALELFKEAKLNKIPLFFLHSAINHNWQPSLKTELEYYIEKQRRTEELTILASQLLEDADIPFTIFKTIKPFPYTPSDVDILLYSKSDLPKVFEVLKRNEIKPSSQDAYGVTMFSSKQKLNLDLTTRIAVSGFIYLDNKVLFEHICRSKVKGIEVQTLDYPFELIVAAAHCLYKEQMYTLSDYYTFALLSDFYEDALNLIDKTHTLLALNVAFNLTYEITTAAFGSNSHLSNKLKNFIQENPTFLKDSRLITIPIKYPPYIIIKALLKKIIEDPSSRRSLPTAVKYSIKPQFVSRIFGHVTRKSY